MPDETPAASVSANNPSLQGAEEGLIRLATEIAGYGTISDLLENLPAHLSPLFPFDGVGIVLHDPATDEVTLRLSFGVPDTFAPPTGRRPVQYGPAGWVFRSQQPRFDALTAESTHPTLALLYEAGFRSALWLPLSTTRARLGTFVVVRKTADPISPDYDRRMKWSASIVALAIEHISQVEALERLRQQIADERDRAHGAMSELGERVKELTALHHTARLLEDEQLGVAGLLEQIATLLPPAFQFPDVTEASVFYGDAAVQTPGFVETPWKMAAEFQTTDGTRGALSVVYLDAAPGGGGRSVPG